MKKYRVWAEIDLNAIKHNIRVIQKRVKEHVKILMVVKADAYGHGEVPVARTALEAGAYMLGVGDSNEALQLRESGILAPILILGALIEEEIGWIVSYEIIPTIHSHYFLKLVEREAKRQNRIIPVHIKVDTGMTRLGTSPSLAMELARKMLQSNNLILHGLSTHLSSSNDMDQSYSFEQYKKFEKFLNALEAENIKVPFVHAANSAAIFNFDSLHYNMIRPGIAVYGMDPGGLKIRSYGIKPALSLKTQITFLKGVRKGTYVGYNRTFITKEDTMIAVLPVGYNDGYPYALSNKAWVLIRGQRAPVVGTVTMDYTMVDVGKIKEVEVGDEVMLIGEQEDQTITANDLAQLAGTIPYEITCALGKRVKRVYVENGEE